jgi:drug/metabolite transporter (DMT)-like permease
MSKGFCPNFMIALGMVCFWTSVGHFIEVFAEYGGVNDQTPTSMREALRYFIVLVLGFIFLWLPKRSWISLGDFEPERPVER